MSIEMGWNQHIAVREWGLFIVTMFFFVLGLVLGFRICQL